MFDNDIFIPHFYIMLEAELQVMKKSKPGKIYSFSPYPVHIKKKKNEFDNDIFGSALSEKDPYYVFSNFLFCFFLIIFFTLKGFSV